VKRVLISTVPIIVAILLQVPQPPEPPSPTPPKSSQNKQSHTDSIDTKANNLESYTSAVGTARKTNLPQTVRNNSEKDGNGKPSEDWRIVLFTGVIAVVAIFQYLVTRKQWSVMDKQLKQMESGTRPWISVDPHGIQSDPIMISARGSVCTKVSLRVRNLGNYPGALLSSYTELLVCDISCANDIVTERLQLYRDEIITFKNAPSPLLFPDGGHPHQSGEMITVEEKVVRRDLDARLMVFLIGQLVYSDPMRHLDRANTRYRTVFAYVYQFPDSFLPIVFDLVPGSTLPSGGWAEWKTLAD
jgi:hypothetical protein